MPQVSFCFACSYARRGMKCAHASRDRRAGDGSTADVGLGDGRREMLESPPLPFTGAVP
jgi:hypothetical protein